jgi:Zn-dependent M28 family amino/carboxypeptidase
MATPMRIPHLVATLLLVTLTLGAQAPVLPEAVRRGADGISADTLWRDLEFLASDELAGRNTPSAGFDTAAKYIAARLERAGLQPAGDDHTFFQHYELHESRVDAAGAYLEVAGRRFALGPDFVLRSFAGVPPGERAVVYVGHGWVVPDKGIDPYAGVDVKGKIVLAHGPRALPKGVEIKQIGRVSVGASNVVAEAARRGAVAVIYIPQKDALTGWDRMAAQNLVRRELEPAVPSAYAAPAATSVLLAAHAAEALLAGEALPPSELISRGDAADYPASFQLNKAVTLHVPAKTIVHRPYNVVAILPGSDSVLRNEYITVEAHLDGAVGSATVNGDSIYNSADDNATGSAGLLSIAERIGASRPKRSLIFIWDSGEEQGLWGTRFFVSRPPVPLERVVAHVNIDMIGATKAPGGPDATEPRVTGPNEVYVIGPQVLSQSASQLLDAANGAYRKMRFNRDFDRPESEFFYPRTDAGPFLERGILTIGFTTGIHARYHLPADDAGSLDRNKLEAVTRTAFISIHALADAAERPRIDRPIPSTVPRYR